MKRFILVLSFILIGAVSASAIGGGLDPIRISVVTTVNPLPSAVTVDIYDATGVTLQTTFSAGNFATDGSGVLSCVLDHANWKTLVYSSAKDYIVRVTYNSTLVMNIKLKDLIHNQGLYGALIDPGEMDKTGNYIFKSITVGSGTSLTTIPGLSGGIEGIALDLKDGDASNIVTLKAANVILPDQTVVFPNVSGNVMISNFDWSTYTAPVQNYVPIWDVTSKTFIPSHIQKATWGNNAYNITDEGLVGAKTGSYTVRVEYGAIPGNGTETDVWGTYGSATGFVKVNGKGATLASEARGIAGMEAWGEDDKGNIWVADGQISDMSRTNRAPIRGMMGFTGATSGWVSQVGDLGTDGNDVTMYWVSNDVYGFKVGSLFTVNQTGAVTAGTWNGTVIASTYLPLDVVYDADLPTALGSYYTKVDADARFQPLDADLSTIAGLTVTDNQMLRYNSGAWTAWTPNFLTAEVDGIIGNEVTDAANLTLTRSGTGIVSDPYKLALNLANPNQWTGLQTFQSTIAFEGTTVDANELTVGAIDPTAVRAINFPNASGTVMITGFDWSTYTANVQNYVPIWDVTSKTFIPSKIQRAEYTVPNSPGGYTIGNVYNVIDEGLAGARTLDGVPAFSTRFEFGAYNGSYTGTDPTDPTKWTSSATGYLFIYGKGYGGTGYTGIGGTPGEIIKLGAAAPAVDNVTEPLGDNAGLIQVRDGSVSDFNTGVRGAMGYNTLTDEWENSIGTYTTTDKVKMYWKSNEEYGFKVGSLFTVNQTGNVYTAGTLTFDGSTIDPTNRTTLTVVNPTAVNTITFPDATGTVVLTTTLAAETDPVFGLSPAFGITGPQITNWDAAFTHVATDVIETATDVHNAELDPIVGAINGLVKADGTGAISAAEAGTDYLEPASLTLQNAYTNSNPKTIVIDNIDDATGNPITITSEYANGGLDVYASGDAEDAIDARIVPNVAVSQQGAVIGTLDDVSPQLDYYGILGGKSALGSAGVAGGIVTNDDPPVPTTYGALGATIETGTGDFTNYAGYFVGDVAIFSGISGIDDITPSALFVSNDAANVNESDPASLVHIYQTTTIPYQVALNVFTTGGLDGAAIRATTAEPKSYGMVVNSKNGADAGYAALVVLKSYAVDVEDNPISTEGSAIVAQGFGTGSTVFINDYSADPATNSYTLEVKKANTESAALYVSNENTASTATAIQVGKGRVVLAAAEATTKAALLTMGNYSIINYTDNTSAAHETLATGDLPAGVPGQILYIINNTDGAINVCGSSGVTIGQMIMVVNYGGTWYAR